MTGSPCPEHSANVTAITPAEWQLGSLVKRFHEASGWTLLPSSTDKKFSSLGVGRKAWEVGLPFCTKLGLIWRSNRVSESIRLLLDPWPFRLPERLIRSEERGVG